MQETTKTQATRAEVREASPVRVFLVWLLSLLIRAWGRTLRFEATPEAMRAATHDAPSVVLVWHNRLFLVPYALRKLRNRRPVYGLVSASRDGAALAAYFRFIGMRAVRGSSSRLGREALHELIGRAREGHDIAITPDGPRGPIYSMRAGAFIAARRTGMPIVLLGFVFSSAWRLPSWDALYLPKPFSRVRLQSEVIFPEALEKGQLDVEGLRNRLLAVSGEALPPPVPVAKANDAPTATSDPSVRL